MKRAVWWMALGVCLSLQAFSLFALFVAIPFDERTEGPNGTSRALALAMLMGCFVAEAVLYGLSSRRASRSKTRGWVLGGAVLIACTVAAGGYVWDDWRTERVAVARTRTAVRRRWEELQRLYPPGTSQARVFTELQLDLSSAEKTVSGVSLHVLIPIDLPRGWQRDYRGFSFEFVGEALQEVRPIGPDGPGEVMSEQAVDALERRIEGLRP